MRNDTATIAEISPQRNNDGNEIITVMMVKMMVLLMLIVMVVVMVMVYKNSRRDLTAER